MSQLLMAVLITLYLLTRAGPPRRWPSQPALALLTGFFLLLSGFSFLLLVDASTTPSYRLYFSFFENPLISLALVLLIQFAYRYADRQAHYRYEINAALLFSGGYALAETGYAVWRFQQLLSTGTVFFRQPYADLALLLVVLWLVWAFLRQGDHTGRVFAAIFLIIVAVALINLLHSLQLVSTFVQEISSTMGILVSMFLFAMAYLHSQQAQASFTIKLAGGLLTALMVVLSSIIWAIAPLYARQYQPRLPEQRTLRLTPQPTGDYRASWQALNWDADYGTHLDSIGPNQPEEFVLLLPHTNCDLACQIAERIASAIRTTDFDLGGPQPVRISVSIGIACAHAPMPELDPLLHQADASLYQAKANGRDRWVCYNPTAIER
ncbi:MAG: diguanylate cyclase [Oscillochloridaceae bacterium umkhey_bin13]